MKRMARFSLFLALLSMPVVAAAASPVLTYRTVGGFTLYNFNVDVYADGTVIATRNSHRSQADTLTFTGYVSAGTVTALASALDAAGWSRTAPTLRVSTHMIADMPSHVARYKGRTVTVNPMGSSETPVASSRLQTALAHLGALYTTVAEERYLSLTAGGGWGFNQSLSISRGGFAVFSRGGRAPVAKKEAQLASAQMNKLTRAIKNADWPNLPAHFAGPRVMDGVTTTVSVFNRYNRGKAVQHSSGAPLTAAYRAVLTAISDITTALSQP